MAEYLLYVLNADGSRELSRDLYAVDDDEALHLARLRQVTADIELWCGERKVALLPRGMPAVMATQESA
jgi:hypothetical protein